tara:strand:+ start:195 stop:422 length:228 start_codon:yes stop_codon:yes gene_type:complete
MCVGPLRPVATAVGAIPSKKERNDAPVITGRQTDVDAPIDTSKATARLKRKREGDPAKKFTARGRSRSPLDLKIM